MSDAVHKTTFLRIEGKSTSTEIRQGNQPSNEDDKIAEDTQIQLQVSQKSLSLVPLIHHSQI